MSLPLLKATFRKNVLLWLIFLGVLLMYSTVMISMFSPESVAALNAMFTVLPPDMMKALGFSDAFGNLLGYLASWLYGLIMTAFPMVYCIILGHRLVAKTVDSGSVASILALPCSRNRLIVTKGIYALGSMALLQMMMFGANLLLARAMFPAELIDAYLFFKLNVTVMLLNVAVMSLAFFFSCAFNEARWSLGLGAGGPIVFLLMNMLGNASTQGEALKRFSLYGWYDPVGIINGEATLVVNLAYAAIAAALFAAGVWVFRKKRLPV